MSILDRFFMWALPGASEPALVAEPIEPQAAFQPSDGGIVISNSKQLEDYIRGLDVSASGTTVNDQTAMRTSAVYGCVRIIGGCVANMPVDVGQKKNGVRTELPDNQVSKLLSIRPNGWQQPADFKRMLMVQTLLHGNGYAQIVRSRGKIIDLNPLAARRMTVTQRDDLSIAYEYRRKDGGRTVFEQRDIFHLRGMSFDGVVGVSPITFARESIGLALTTERFGGSLFKNGTSLGLVLTHPKALSDKARANLKQSLEEWRGAGSAGRTLVTEEGVKIDDKVGMTNEDAQFLETRKFQRSDIAMFFGVPPFMLGDTEKSTSWGSGIEQQNIGFVTYSLEDWLTMWEQAIQRQLLNEADADVSTIDPSIYARFNRNALVRGDIDTRYAAYVRGLQWGFMNPDQVRSLEDMNPREDGKGGEYYPPPNASKPVENDAGTKTTPAKQPKKEPANEPA